MKNIFLDTSAYSAFKRNNQFVLDVVRMADALYLNATVIGELYAGFDGGKYQKKNRDELREFLQDPSVIVLPITEETAEKYSFIYHSLKQKGRPIPTNDLWIAASVMECGASLLTLDSHFKAIDQIQAVFPLE